MATRYARLPAGKLGVSIDPLPSPQAVKHWRELNAALALRGTRHKPLPGTAHEVAALAGLVVGCPSNSGKPRVAFVSNNPEAFWSIAEAGAKKAAEENGVELIFQKPASSDVSTQKEKIDQVLKTLTYREREIIKLRYGLGDGYTYTLEEVGRIFKVTRERVRQIEAKAVRKLQHPVRSRQLEGFLESTG